MYAHEDDEWRRAVHDSTELELHIAQDAHRAGLGLTGDIDDEKYGGNW